jgi:hypothetical protein
VLAIVVGNWPDAGLMLETDAIGLSPERSDEERLELRKAGANTLGVTVNGKVWVPSAIGIAADGSASSAGRRSMDFVWRLESWETEPEAQLAVAEQAINDAVGQEVAGEWTAAVDEGGTLGLLRSNVFYQLLSLRPAV